MYKRYPHEFKHFAIALNRRRVGTQIIAQALGCSTKTVWKWIVNYRGKLGRHHWVRKRAGGYVEIRFRGKIKHFGRSMIEHRWLVNNIKECFMRLVRWIYYRDVLGGELDMQACMDGEEPP
jgi:biotin synthase-related radical SAM superfamily protein